MSVCVCVMKLRLRRSGVDSAECVSERNKTAFIGEENAPIDRAREQVKVWMPLLPLIHLCGCDTDTAPANEARP